MAEAVTLVGHGGARVFFQVVLHMVHAHVMAEVTLGGMTEERADQPGNVPMYPLSGLLKTFAMAEAVKHKPEPSLEIELREVEVGYGDHPPPEACQQGSK